MVDAEDELLTPRFYLSEPLRGREDWLRRQAKRLARFRIASLPQWLRFIGKSRAITRQA